jgi:hypothetical protein
MLNSDKNNCLDYPGCLWGKFFRKFTHYFNKSILYTQILAECEECLKLFSCRVTDLPEFKFRNENTL